MPSENVTGLVNEMSKRHYFFLLDNSVKHLRPFFPEGVTETTIDHGLAPHADDMDVIDLGRLRRAIIVTTDLKFPEKCQAYQHPEEYLPFGVANVAGWRRSAEEGLGDLRSGKRKIRHPRHERPLTWADVNLDNLTVKLHRSSEPNISELCDCPWDEEK